MDFIRVSEVEPGEYSLGLEAGTTAVDDVISGFGHEPNGYFWEGIVELLVMTEVPALAGRFSSDPEGGGFYAYSGDRSVLEELAGRLRAVVADPVKLRQLMQVADARGFEFDD